MQTIILPMSNATEPANQATLKKWIELYSDKLYTWALYNTNKKEIAEDLVQDTFLAAYQNIEKFQEKSDPSTWLSSILKNKIADYYRKLYKQNTITESALSKNSDISFFDDNNDWNKNLVPQNWNSTSENLLDDLAFKQVLQDCMSNLPNRWLSVVQLKFLKEKKGDFICQELEIAPTNLWQILHRAKLQLRNCLENHWFKK